MSITGRCRGDRLGSLGHRESIADVRALPEAHRGHELRGRGLRPRGRSRRAAPDADEAAAQLGVSPSSAVRMVAFESSNTVTNKGTASWQPQSGLVSVWILGCSVRRRRRRSRCRSPGAGVGARAVVNDAYFGRVPADRLVVKDGTVFFRGDGRQRGKIGLPSPRALPSPAATTRPVTC